MQNPWKSRGFLMPFALANRRYRPLSHLSRLSANHLRFLTYCCTALVSDG
jgi:hypothetical protein